MNVKQSDCADLIDEADLEDGEIEDEETETENKTVTATQVEKPRPTPVIKQAALSEKNLETENFHRQLEKNEKPKKDPMGPFFGNRGKRKHLDDEEEGRRWKRDEKRNRRNIEPEREGERMAEDEEEMMLVRGASPQRLEEEFERWEQRGEDGEREPREGRKPGRTFRRGSLSRRGERARGRGGRGRGGIRGTKRNKRDEPEMCHFFQQGKCHRGSECTFSHEILPPRKLELCKFFMKDCCAKKDKCYFLHSEFPCKYFHMGLKCYANKKCKFNHGPLTDQLRNLLAKHMDVNPKEIAEYPRQREGRERGDMRERLDPRDPRERLGDFRERGNGNDSRDRNDPRDHAGPEFKDYNGEPRDFRDRSSTDSRDRDRTIDRLSELRDRLAFPRERGDPRDRGFDPREKGDGRGDPREREFRDSREGRKEFTRNRHEKDNRNDPNSFDPKMMDDMKNSDGSHTPMPSPNQNSQDSVRSSNHDQGMQYDRDLKREKERDRGHDKGSDHEREKAHERHKHDKAERREERRMRKEKSREHRKERKEKREKRRESHRDKNSDKTDVSDQEMNKSTELMSPTNVEDNQTHSEVPTQQERDYEDDLERKNGVTDDSDQIPQHLPKKQRELFLRIQQQQREAENSQENQDDDDEDNKDAEENWYSSDEEMTPATSLPSVLKSLTQTSSNTNTTTTTSTAAAAANPVMPLLNLLASASAAFKPAEVTSPTPVAAPAVAPIIPPNLDLSNFSSVFEALKNLQSMSSSSTGTNVASQPTSTVAVPPVTPSVETSVSPAASLPDPPKPPEPPVARAPRRDPRLLRSEAGSIDHPRTSTESYDTDLRHKTLPSTPSSPVSSATDVDLRSLPFKPVQHTAACEIIASLDSHSPIAWHLVPANIIKPDYASLQIQPKPGINDPRLRRVARPVSDDIVLPRDPRQRLVDEPARDPRARPPLLATPAMPPSPLYSGPPATPRYDEDHRPPFYRMDSDMRQFPPPTPRLEDEAYSPGPSRPVDPRQRHDDPRMRPRPDDVDLRTQLAHRVPFMSYNK